tara:strand:- start:467 stop:802 length:336 start_codon:yes stop_codon:yes gene_type:complete
VLGLVVLIYTEIGTGRAKKSGAGGKICVIGKTLILNAFIIKGWETTLPFRPGDLVEFNSFESARRGKSKVMLVIEKFKRLKREGAYYRVIDGDQLTICHESQIQKAIKHER